MADRHDSGSCVGNDVWVQVPSSAFENEKVKPDGLAFSFYTPRSPLNPGSRSPRHVWLVGRLGYAALAPSSAFIMSRAKSSAFCILKTKCTLVLARRRAFCFWCKEAKASLFGEYCEMKQGVSPANPQKNNAEESLEPRFKVSSPCEARRSAR